MSRKTFNVKQVIFSYLQLLLAISCLITFMGLRFAYSQNTDAKMTKLSVQTDDLITIEVTTLKNTLVRGDDIVINYRIANYNKKTIFLVSEPSQPIFINEDFIIELMKPVRLPDDHRVYDYDLIKISPQKVYKGNLIIKAKYYLENKDYDFSIAKIQVGFSYLFDKTNLEDCKQATYVRPCFFELYKKSKSLTLGNFVIEIKKS
ncbi:MAG: hypothetical protein KF736_11060 [Acidobacteria bacterium]|nr:hypothetical protein [Acidobacteriota bacterium]MCW5950059.1 hypothetical protein [Pyrinomonadaceae bacterium]